MESAKRRYKDIEVKTFVIDDESSDLWRPEQFRKELGVRIIRDLRAGALELRPLPDAALRLADLARDPDPSIEDAVSVLERDPALTSRVLKLAASPAMSRRPPADLLQAALTVGVHQLRDMAFAVAAGRVFRAPGLDDEVQHEHLHSFQVGVATAEVFKRMGIGSKQGFLVGMLHDIGALLLYSALSQYGRESPEFLEPEFIARARRVLHAALGDAVIRSWGLSETVRAGAKYHHHPDDAGALSQVAQAVSVADYAAKLEATGEADRAAQLSQHAPLYAAGLNPGDAAAIAAAIDSASGI
ncbi:MAG: HDOD domain-containing protein [Nannocystaceae bacterium]|nr:HDOD domain-containing protein [Nannocystaceae bacterium]